MRVVQVRVLNPDGSKSNLIEWIGPLEQPFMDIAIREEDFRKNVTTHIELSSMAMLSDTASFTPFSGALPFVSVPCSLNASPISPLRPAAVLLIADFNQSPRNMYQCQMGKQTMGTPFHSYPHRIDNKVYRLQTPQRPITRTEAYEHYGMNEYPLGTNACVAVISHTGYDMEDAMIINKSAYERGFGHASVYKYKKVDLGEKAERGQQSLLLPPALFAWTAWTASRLHCVALCRSVLMHCCLFARTGEKKIHHHFTNVKAARVILSLPSALV